MEFWGVEVKSGKPLSVQPGDGMVIHLSQACLGELNDKGKDSVCLFVNIDGQKLVLGTLSPERLPQQQFDLVFDRDFELSHNWKKNGSVYFYGYKAHNVNDDSEDESDYDSEDIPFHAINNEIYGLKPMPKKSPVAAKADALPASTTGNQKVKIVEPKKDGKSDEDDRSSDEDDRSSDEDEDLDTWDESESAEDDLSDDEESEGDDEETPQKVELSKKRPAESASKTPAPAKKAKLVTPQKTDGKKGGGSVHVATPYPSKHAGKAPATQAKPQNPKSTGSHSCKSCTKTFNSDQALQSHSKAKHSGGK